MDTLKPFDCLSSMGGEPRGPTTEVSGRRHHQPAGSACDGLNVHLPVFTEETASRNFADDLDARVERLKLAELSQTT